MTLQPPAPVGNPGPALTADQRLVLTNSAVDPDWAAGELRALPEGCDIRFPGLGSPAGVLRACDSCRAMGRPKYTSAPGLSPQPTVVHQGPEGSPLLYVEGVLKALSAAWTVQTYALALTVVFLNGADGINAGTRATLAAQAPGRDAVVVFDADIASNPHVAASALRAEGHLRRAGAVTVRFAQVPRVADDPSTGLDDYLASRPPAERAAELSALVDGAAPDVLAPGFAGRAAELDPAERTSLARAAATRVCSLGMDEGWVQEWRDLLKETCRFPGSAFDSLRKDAAARQKREARERAEKKITEAGPLMPSPSEPLEVAHTLLERAPHIRDQVRIWRGDWYKWRGTHWQRCPVTELTDWLRGELRHAWYMSAGKEPAPVPWSPTTAKISEVVEALASVIRRGDDDEPDTGIFAINGRVNLDGTLADHTPAVFNTSSLPYPYQPDAACPAWDAFLASSLPEQADRELLQEMFGYLLSGATNQQKIFFLSGPPGSGKGTTLRVLNGLVGPDAHTATSLPAIGSHFGLASLIGKSVAVMPDVRFNVSGAGDALPALLSVSGEDTMSVARKNRDDWVGTLRTRIVMASNDLPTLPDSSAALYRRLVVIRFGQSFTGREDHGLTGRLLGELSGILNWALAGYRRLMARGRFLSTAGGAELAAEARREASPVAAFTEDICVADPDAFTTSADLFAAWTAYRMDQGFSRKDLSKPGLTRAVCSAVPGTVAKVKKVAGTASRGVLGIRLKSAH
jgi:putative DNA primase/helicase